MTAANSSLPCATGVECWLRRFRRVVHAAFTIITVLRNSTG
jgi:hypothetical protein